MKSGDKYKIDPNEDEHEVLPNKLDITDKSELEKEEAKGFIEADVHLSFNLKAKTKFNKEYIFEIHHLAFHHLYEFAGKYRTVNISKGGFNFPPAKYLDNSMSSFQSDILAYLKDEYPDKESLIEDVAKVHGELLYIHPFREGNGRIARLLANLMVSKAGYERLKFKRLDNKEKFDEYVNAVQKAGLKQYEPMIEIIRQIF